jgi:hypothetical protein
VIDVLIAMVLARPPAWLLLGEIADGKLRLRQPYGPIPEDDAGALQDWGLLELDGSTVPSAAAPFWSQLLAAIQAPGLTDRAPDNDGVEGEEAVVASEMARLGAMGRQDLAEKVTRVSLVSDGFGYDVRSYFGVESDGWDSHDELHIEVKSTTVAARRSQDFRLFLTRHEFEVSRRDRSWVLACWAPEAGWPLYVRRTSLVACVPTDVTRGRWHVALMGVALQHAAIVPITAIESSARI